MSPAVRFRHKREELARIVSTRIWRSVASATPAASSIRPKTVTVCATPGPPFFFQGTGRAEIGGEQQLIAVACVEERENRRDLLSVRDNLNRDAIEADEHASLRQLFRDLRWP